MQPEASSRVEKNPSANPYPVVPGAALPWWLTSKTFYGLLTLVVAFLISKASGATVTPEDSQVLDIATNVIEIVGAGLVLIGRVHAQMKIRAASLPAAPVLPIEPYHPQPEAFRHGGPLASPVILFAALVLGGCAAKRPPLNTQHSTLNSFEKERSSMRATAPTLRAPDDVPDSWRRTLHHRDETGAPVIIIPTAIPADPRANFAAR